MNSHVKSILESMDPSSYSDFIEKALQHLFNKPGKMLRSALILFAVNSVNVSAEQKELCLRLAAVIEMIHSASLVHDDIIDSSKSRRDQVSLNEAYGNKVAVIVGDLLFTKAFSVIAGAENISTENRIYLINALTSLTRKMCFGEVMEARCRKLGSTMNCDDYLTLITNKTAYLIGDSILAALKVAGIADEICTSLYEYGLNIGIAFQLSDDSIDRDTVFQSGNNIREKADMYVKKAINNLSVLRESDHKEALKKIGQYIMERMNK
ncbi:MAG: polyprenyl synthetase family protein [Spirochaetales bacterium]|nr:polyprenyl synthetase family protein [Spirochaetales bacterium]